MPTSFDLPSVGSTGWGAKLNTALSNVASLFDSTLALFSNYTPTPKLSNALLLDTVIATGSDQAAEVQSKLDALADGGTLQIIGQVRTSVPIVARRNKTIRGQSSPRWSYQTTPPTSIRPMSGFAGLAAVLVPEKSITDSSLPAIATARTDDNDNGALVDLAVDCSAISPGGDRGIYGVFLEGLVRNWRLSNVSTLSARGKGIAMEQGRGTRSPRGVQAEHLSAVYSKNLGISLQYVTDSHMTDLLAVGGELDGQVHLACCETQFDEIRSVFNKGRGTVLAGSNSNSNPARYGTIDTDRNAFDGVALEQTGTFPLHITKIVAARDGSASTTAHYAGVTFGDGTTALAPVIVGDLVVTPGYDDGGGGSYTPQHAAHYRKTTRVVIGNRWGWSSDAPVYDEGGHSNAPRSVYDYLRTTTAGTVQQAGPQTTKTDLGLPYAMNSYVLTASQTTADLPSGYTGLVLQKKS